MRIEEVLPEDRVTVQAIVTLMNAVSAADAPWVHPMTVTKQVGTMRHGWQGEAPRCFAARDDAEAVVGYSELWTFEHDNRDLAWLSLAVAPERRRQGIGSLLMRHLLATAAECGRTKAGVDGWDSPGTYAFAAAHGFEKKSQSINRRQVLAEMDRALVRKLYDEAAVHAAAYDLERVVGHTPEERLDEVAEMTAAINDAPLDDLDIEDETFTPERIRGYEDAVTAKGQRLYRLMARHRETARLAGQTIVAVDQEHPEIGHQHDTSVVREHRGNRLGLLLKAGMVLWLAEAEPQLETVDTWNAESNGPMIGVNEQLGYQVMGRGLEFMRTL